MRRIQIYIDEDLDESLAVAASQTGRSKAALIRMAVRDRLGQTGPVPDPLDELVGAYQLEPGDVDELVYGG